MLEIPESQTLAKQMTQALKGRRVARVIAGAAPHAFCWYSGDPILYDDMLRGKTAGGTSAYGGMVELQLEDMRLLLNDGACPRFWESAGAAPQKHQLCMLFEDGACLTVTVKMYGGIWVYPEGGNDNPYYLSALKKISPLEDAFDESYFLSLLGEEERQLSAKAFLATGQRVPGLGNGVLQDILFRAGVHPKRKMETLAPEQISAMYHAVKDVLMEMTQKGGRDTERDLYGREGGYHTLLSRKTLSGPCPACGRSIAKAQYMGGAVYFCAGCQPER